AGNGTPISPARIADGIRFVVEIKENSRVVLEFRRDRGPESRRMIHVRHRRLTFRYRRSGGGPVQIQNGVDAICVQQIHVIDHSVLVVGAGIGGGYPVDPEPAMLIHRDSDRIDIPILDGLHGCGIHGPVEDSRIMHTRVFPAWTIYTEQTDGLPTAVDQLISDDSDRQSRSRRWWRRSGPCRYGEVDARPVMPDRSRILVGRKGVP